MFSHKKFQESVRPNNIKGNRPSADPFIIAKAKSLGKNGVVITRETLKKNSAQIPNICAYYGILCEDDRVELLKYLFGEEDLD